MFALCSSLLLWLAGCACQPELPDVEPDPPAFEDTSVRVTGHTGPEPPCAVPEVEPNDSVLEPTTLPMELQGCGVFDVAADLDTWAFELAEEGWISIQLDAMVNGSSADPGFILASEGGLGASRFDDLESRDAHLVFPTSPDTFTITVLEENDQFGDRYDYELLVTQAKEPVFWHREELEDNDSSATAELLVDGDRILGGMNDAFDGDWYRIDVPPGRHTVILDVDAYAEGSNGDFTLYLYDDTGVDTPSACGKCVFGEGEVGFEPDPWLEYDSNGDETIYVQVREIDNRGGDPFWYLLAATVEGG